MKFFTKYIKWSTLFLVFVIFILQGIWLFQTFQLTKENYKKDIYKKFALGIKQEVQRKFEELNIYTKNEKKNSKKQENSVFKMPEDSLWIHKDFPIDIMVLELLNFKNFHIDISRISTTLKKEDKNLGDFVINRVRTKDNIVLESTAPKTKTEWASSLKTKAIPLRVDESEILQLYILNPNWTIFYQMAFIIFLSALIIGLVTIGIWWQYKNYINEKLLRKFQKDHTEAVIHNMATPLQTIRVANESLKILPQEQQQKFLIIQEKQIVSLESQVKKILTVARANKSGLAINSENINIEEFIQNICEKYKSTEYKQIQLQTTFDLAKPTVLLDTQLFTDVLDNLIENAIKYSRESVAITIDCKRTNDNFIVKVTDNGLGIAPKYQKNIFEKFNRGAAPFRQGAKGFGIGLNFVKTVVEAHKGIVTLFSKGENKGTTFTLSIPQNTEL